MLLPGCSFLTKLLEAKHPAIGEFCSAQECRSADFEASNLSNVRSGCLLGGCCHFDGFLCHPTDLITIAGDGNPLIQSFERNTICLSSDFEALKWRKGRSGNPFLFLRTTRTATDAAGIEEDCKCEMTATGKARRTIMIERKKKSYYLCSRPAFTIGSNSSSTRPFFIQI